MNTNDLLKEADGLRFQSKTQQAIPLYRQVVDQASGADDHKLAGHALHMIGVCYKMDNQSEEAIEALIEASKYYAQHGYTEKEGVVLADIASTHDYSGDLEQAKQVFESAIDKLKTGNDRGAYGSALSRLGHIKSRVGDPSAFEDLTHAIEVLKSTDAWFFLATAIGYLGYYYTTQNKFELALDFVKQALDIYQSHPEEQHPRRIAQSQGGVAFCYAQLGDKEQARHYLRLALNMILEDNLTISATQVLLDDIRAEETLHLLLQP